MNSHLMIFLNEIHYTEELHYGKKNHTTDFYKRYVYPVLRINTGPVYEGVYIHI
jgi:hypothetical protein